MVVYMDKDLGKRFEVSTLQDVTYESSPLDQDFGGFIGIVSLIHTKYSKTVKYYYNFKYTLKCTVFL